MRFRVSIFYYIYIVYFILHSIKRHVILGGHAIENANFNHLLRGETARFCQCKSTYLTSVIIN